MDSRLILEGILDTQSVSFKKNTRTREKGVFSSFIEGLNIPMGKFFHVSHKEWLASLSPEVRDNLTPASKKNGPRYTLKNLKPNGYTCVAGSLSGSDLEVVAEREERDLTDTDTIYSITPTPKVQ